MNVLRRRPRAAHLLRRLGYAAAAGGALVWFTWFVRPESFGRPLLIATAALAVAGVAVLVAVPPVPPWMLPPERRLGEWADPWIDALRRFCLRRRLARALRGAGLIMILAGAPALVVCGGQAAKFTSWANGWRRWALKPNRCPEPLSTIEEGIRYNDAMAVRWGIPAAAGFVVLVTGLVPVILLPRADEK